MYCCYNIKNIKPAVSFYVFFAEKKNQTHRFVPIIACGNLIEVSVDRFLFYLRHSIARSLNFDRVF